MFEASGKYWENTIKPLTLSGHTASLVSDSYQYPHRVGIFPGLSCMYYCSFCGRNKSAAYDRSIVDDGIDLYKQMITDAPRDTIGWEDRFRISGGQEPLTNPRVGELVTHAASYGYKVSMYTNGHMLTPSLIEKQSGLQSLKSLRISMYGYDEESYTHVTKNRHSWKTVTNNLKQLHMPNTNIGMNWIILPGHGSDYLKFINFVKNIDMKQQLKYITVREDFSQNLVVISDEERKELIDIIHEANAILPDVHIDYGYALAPLLNGEVTGPLKMADYTQLPPYGIPQASVQVDIKGNIYVFHETAFLDRPGSDKFIIGNIRDGLENVIKSHLANRIPFEYIPSDTEMLDAYDHAVSLWVYSKVCT